MGARLLICWQAYPRRATQPLRQPPKQLRNEVADLKSALKQVGEGGTLPAPVNERKQRSRAVPHTR